MPLTVATWNINSVRIRMDNVARFLAEHGPDILCLQEIKCPPDLFPAGAFAALGYPHVAVHGQKGYHGVATVSRRPLTVTDRMTFCGVPDCRHLATRFQAGGREILLHEPDPSINAKFRHKLDFVQEMRQIRAGDGPAGGSILVGDLNIAPLEHDVWSHRQLLNVVSHTPAETGPFEAMRKEGQWVDLMRQAVHAETKLYTWWSYRARDWEVSDRGRRLDHIWSSANLAERFTRLKIVREARGWDRPSDHVPVLATFAIEE
jgi:exodeoxyribonuclease-3